MRLIDADALVQSLIEKAISYRPGMFSNECEYRVAKVVAFECANESKNAPTVDAEPVRHGYWIVKKTAIGAEYTICSECKTDFKFKTDKGTFARLDMRGMLGCPNCRAKMDMEEQK